MHDSTAYDRGTTTFSPDGRLYQVEYAREAVARGQPCVGVRTTDGVVLAATRRVRSPLMVTESVEKLHAADEHVAVASAGHVADARQLVDVARRQAQTNRLRYDEPVAVETLTKQVTDHVQEHTQAGGTRPFGAALLVGGVENGEPRLFETDPGGTPSEWQAACVGADRGSIQEHLESNFDPDLALDEGVDLALEALAVPAEAALTPGEVSVVTVAGEPTAVDELDTDARRARLAALDLLDESAS